MFSRRQANVVIVVVLPLLLFLSYSFAVLVLILVHPSTFFPLSLFLTNDSASNDLILDAGPDNTATFPAIDLTNILSSYHY